MFGDEGGFVGGELSEFRKVFFGACVTDGNTGIPDEWLEFDSLDRGLREDTPEVFESHIKKVRERMGEDVFTGVKEVSRETLAKRFQGQASRQSSQP